jgi:flagellar biogenesis protein FliO
MDLDIIFALLQTLIALAAVIALAFLVLRVGGRLNTGNNNFVKILEKTTVSNHSYLAVAKVGSEYHLISVTSGEIKILKDISAEEMEAAILEKRKHFEENPINNKIKEVMKRLGESHINKVMQVRKNRE